MISSALMRTIDALCFFVILFTVAPHVSRGCCYTCSPSRGCAERDSVLQCILNGDRDEDDIIRVKMTKDCDFGSQNVTSIKGVVIDKFPHFINNPVLTFRKKLVQIDLGSITFSHIALAAGGVEGKSVSISSGMTVSSALFTDCVFRPGVNIVFETFVHVTVERCHFNLTGEGPTMLQIQKGSLEFIGGNNIVRCLDGCTHTTIKVTICHNTTLKDVELVHDWKSAAHIFEFYPCVHPVENVPTLKIEGITFKGLVHRLSSWMILRGDNVKGPMVVLRDNDYDGLATSVQTQTGSVFFFVSSIPLNRSDEKSRFTLSRSSSRSAPSGWHDDAYLATAKCYLDGETAVSTHILPIGPIKDKQRYDICAPYCCYVEESGMKKHQERSIAGCLKHVEMREATTVNVMNDCPFGNPLALSESTTIYGSIVNNELATHLYEKHISKKKFGGDDKVVITFEEGDYSFVNDNHQPIVFKNFHFKKATGAGVAKILLGHEVATDVNVVVKMIGCIVDEDIVVEMRHDAHYNAENTTFSQGLKESVLSLVAGVNQVVQLSNCVLAEKSCHTMISGSMCGKVTIKDTELRKICSPSCCKAAVDLATCKLDAARFVVPTLTIEGITFQGQVADVEDAAWIKVEGSYSKGPRVTLLNNDYRGLNENASTQRGRVYRFTDINPIKRIYTPYFVSEFEVFRKVTKRNLDTKWDADRPLATLLCELRQSANYALRIRRGLLDQHMSVGCTDVCCSVKISSSRVRYGYSISECVMKRRASGQTVVLVLSQCPMRYGEFNSLEGDDVVVKSDSNSTDRASVTVELGITYVLDSSTRFLFKDIHFVVERKIGVSAGIAELLVGKTTPTLLESSMEMARVTMDNCVLDADVIVNVVDNVNYTATNTTFYKGTGYYLPVFGLGVAETLFATLVDCTFEDKECNGRMIGGSLCGNVEIKNTVLVRAARCKKPAIVVLKCPLISSSKRATLKLEKLNFTGVLDDEQWWVEVHGDKYGPTVTLTDNNYSNLKSNEIGWQSYEGMVYHFCMHGSMVERYDPTIAFSITRAQTQGGTHKTFYVDKMLATVSYLGEDQNPFFTELIFPIGNGHLDERQIYVVGELCCYAKSSGDGRTEYHSGYSIAKCLEKGEDGNQKQEVTVTRQCPLGDLQEIDNASIQKDESSLESVLSITLNEVQIVPSYTATVTFKNVTFQNASSSPVSNGRRLLR